MNWLIMRAVTGVAHPVANAFDLAAALNARAARTIDEGVYRLMTCLD